MFPSLVPTQALVLIAVCSLVIARDELILEDVPINIVIPAVPGKSIQGGGLESLERNATLRLFPEHPVFFDRSTSFGCKGPTFNTVSLAPDTCLSGDYDPNFNVLIKEAPLCPNGEAPVLNFYNSRGCQGEPAVNTESAIEGIPDECLWGGLPSKYWSMIFRCGSSDSTKGTVEHQAASPLRAPYLEGAKDGIVVSHLFPACNGKRFGGHKALHVPTDRCLTTPGFGIEIQFAAVCANGTRAQWARFSDDKCGNGNLSPIYGLVDIADLDIDQCLSTGVVGEEEKISSMAFWCDGVKTSSPEDDEREGDPDEEEGKPEGDGEASQPGSVSESACLPGRAPSFNHPETDTCVKLKGSKLKIYSMGSCATGTQPVLALYDDKACAGIPTEFRDIEEEDMRACIDIDSASSFALYCTGEGIGAPEADLPSDPNAGEQSGGILQFFLVLFLILLMFVLMLVLSVYTWVRKYGGSAGRLVDLVRGLWKPKEGVIAL